MSADQFERLQQEINGPVVAFSERYHQAKKAFCELQAIERELKHDEDQFHQLMNKLRSRLEGHTRALTQAHSRHARLVRELAACNEDIRQHEVAKEETSRYIYAATDAAARERDEKLRRYGMAPPLASEASAAPAAPAPSPVANLLDMEPTVCDTEGNSALMPAAALGDLHRLDLLSPAPAPGPLDLLEGLSGSTRSGVWSIDAVDACVGLGNGSSCNLDSLMMSSASVPSTPQSPPQLPLLDGVSKGATGTAWVSGGAASHTSTARVCAPGPAARGCASRMQTLNTHRQADMRDPFADLAAFSRN